jgi:hypothetical protein
VAKTGRGSRPSSDTGRAAYIAVALAALTLGVYAPVRSHAFISFDDPLYVTANPIVRQGLSFDGLKYAFTGIVASNWQPLTVLSHQLDVELFGVNAGAHHLVNALIHAVNAALLFWVLYRGTGAMWRSAMVAALFATHPLHVESVAWISERKDVLCTLFWLLTMWAYLRRIERPDAGRYVAVVAYFALGLMAKTMLVTLPFVLLLLDAWPLRRLSMESRMLAAWGRELRPRLVEKAPLFALALLFSLIALYTQRHGAAIAPTEQFPILVRVANALVAYVIYLRNTIWPAGLAVYYPHEGAAVLDWRPIAAVALLVALTAFVWRKRATAPYALAGWLWYLGTLVPVMGFVQIGLQSHADRYTYVPLVGIFIAVVWGGADLLKRVRANARLAAAGCVVVLAACAVVTRAQLAHWSNTETLFRRALLAAGESYTAHMNLGAALAERGEWTQATLHLSRAAALNPNAADAWFNLGGVSYLQGQHADAVAYYRRVLAIHPQDDDTLARLALALHATGRADEAIATARHALQINPNNATAQRFLQGAQQPK